MSLHSPRPLDGSVLPLDLAAGQGLGLALVRAGVITGDQMAQALSLQTRRGGRLVDVLLARGMAARVPLYEAMAAYWRTSLVDPRDQSPDIRLVDRLGAAFCLRHQLAPLHKMGGVTLVATARLEEFAAHLPLLTRHFGAVAMVLALPDTLEAGLLARRGAALAQAAETRVPRGESCRGLAGSGTLRLLVFLSLILGLFVLLRPDLALWLGVIWAMATLCLSTALKIVAGLASGALRASDEGGLADLPLPPGALPTVSVLVALYREADIAPRLIRRLGRIAYPQELLEILLVEAEDSLTRTALARADLPPWMRVVVVPPGQIKTKPRALNYALDQCRGSIIGVYDAEDAPEPQQISRVVAHFHAGAPDLACLQGVLDFYNPTTNWLSRCFTVEYAVWFRLILPGLARLGLPVPLGGTTVFFRRAALEAVGGWDAHNVTEDADLGIRLVRHGYRTEVLAAVTAEEACCRALPWVKQRSRWLKGYMMTWVSHMRDPRLLWRQLGPWRFAGFQVLFLCTLSQFLLAPLLWSFWITLFGLSHPVAEALPPAAIIALVGLFLMTEATNLALGLAALHRTRHSFSRLWVPTLHFYFPLGALAAYKALWEALTRPFYWDKTSHGQFDAAA